MTVEGQKGRKKQFEDLILCLIKNGGRHESS